MTAVPPGVELNPFEDDIVREPRDVSFSVPGLNDGPLDQLVSTFSRLDRDTIPRRPVAAEKAQMVVSPDRGYGKSHLIGRLFERLGDRATKVYLRPFQDPFKPWHSILLLTVQELERPAGTAPDRPSQLQGLALGALAHIAADFLADGGIPDYQEAPAAIDFLRRLANEAATSGTRHPAWIEWLSWLVDDPVHIGRLAVLLRKRGIRLGGREQAWLRVLGAHAFTDPFDPAREVALKWLRAEPLEPGEIALLRLTASDSEGRGDASAQEINDLSFRRLQGLCLLSSYFRPFLFCFDQTEFYASDHALIRALGNCIDQLYVDMPNHLTVITANNENWLTEILPQIAKPQRNRISPEIRLQGIRLDGARQLIRRRFADYDVPDATIDQFLAPGWLDGVFDPLPEIAVRDLLMRAAERFRRLREQPLPPPPALTDLFELQINDVRAKKALQAYSQDALMWFVKDVGQGQPGVAVGRPAQRKYFSLEWAWPDRSVCFAFEGGDHWQRWSSIAGEATDMADRAGGRVVLAYVFRTPDLPKVPKPTWRAIKPAIEAASRRGFHIVELTLDQVCELHAARELYSNALQGNLAFSGPDTLAFLRERFAPLLRDLAFRKQPERPEVERNGGKPDGHATHDPPAAQSLELDPAVLQTVVDTVRQKRLVDIKAVLAALGRDDLRDPLLRSVERHPNLKAHPGPQTIYLQWRITA